MCQFSLSWDTCGFSAPCHAAGGPSEFPLLADSGWMPYSCGDGFAWGWGLSCNRCPVTPLFLFICDCAASPSGFCTLTEWVCMSVSSLLVYSSGWVGGVLLRPLPQGLQRPLFSRLLVPLGFSGLLLLRLLAGVVGLCTLCQGAPVAVLSAWFAGGVPLLPFLYLRVGVLLAEVSPGFVGCEGGLSCPSWFVILFLCLLVLHLFLELGWFLVTGWWPLLRLLVLDSSVARLHLPDALASASPPISGSWMVQAPAFT